MVCIRFVEANPRTTWDEAETFRRVGEAGGGSGLSLLTFGSVPTIASAPTCLGSGESKLAGALLRQL